MLKHASKQPVGVHDGALRGLPAARLAVSRNATSVEAVDALIGNFPAVGRVLGPRQMRTLTIAFVDRHPATGPVLLGYGAEFPTWLSQQRLAQEKPYLVGLAQIDRLAVEASLAPDGSEFGLRDLASLSAQEWCECRFKFHPATRLAWFPLRVPGLWIGEVDEAIVANADFRRSEGILLTRAKAQVTGTMIGACEHRILHGLRLGETVRQASQAASRLYPDDNITLAFRRIVVSGALAVPSILPAQR